MKAIEKNTINFSDKSPSLFHDWWMLKVLFFLLYAMPFLCFGETLSHIKDVETPLAKALKPANVTEFNPGLELIDCIYVINLDTRPDKWIRVKKLLEENGLKVNRFSAVNGWNFTEEQIQQFCGDLSPQMSTGAYGCLLSFLSIFKDALERGFERVWICEDDIDIVDDVRKIPELMKKLTHLDPDWEILYTDLKPRWIVEGKIQHVHWGPEFPQRPDAPASFSRPQFNVFENDEFIRAPYRTATHSMVFTKKGMKRILDYFTHVYLWAPIDIELHWIPGLRHYSSKHDIVSTIWAYHESDTYNCIDGTPDDEITAAFANKPSALFEQAEKLRNSKKTEAALLAYEKRAAMGGDREEVFWSLYQTAILQETLKRPAAEFCNNYFKAYHFWKERAEPLCRLAMYYRSVGETLLCFLLSEYALKLEEPKNLKYSESWPYHWGLLMEYSVAASWLGKLEIARDSSLELLAKQDLPWHVTDQVHKNMVWILSKLHPPKEKMGEGQIAIKSNHVESADEEIHK